MLRILFHAIILPLMLWLDKRGWLKFHPLGGALSWYALGIPLMIVEASASGREWANILLQSLLVALFFLPPAYFAFRYAKSSRSIWKPFLLFLGLSLVAAFVAALALARAPLVNGVAK